MKVSKFHRATIRNYRAEGGLLLFYGNLDPYSSRGYWWCSSVYQRKHGAKVAEYLSITFNTTYTMDQRKCISAW